MRNLVGGAGIDFSAGPQENLAISGLIHLLRSLPAIFSRESNW